MTVRECVRCRCPGGLEAHEGVLRIPENGETYRARAGCLWMETLPDVCDWCATDEELAAEFEELRSRGIDVR